MLPLSTAGEAVAARLGRRPTCPGLRTGESPQKAGTKGDLLKDIESGGRSGRGVLVGGWKIISALSPAQTTEVRPFRQAAPQIYFSFKKKSMAKSFSLGAD